MSCCVLILVVSICFVIAKLVLVGDLFGCLGLISLRLGGCSMVGYAWV